jgi:hypothetical protein
MWFGIEEMNAHAVRSVPYGYEEIKLAGHRLRVQRRGNRMASARRGERRRGHDGKEKEDDDDDTTDEGYSE